MEIIMGVSQYDKGAHGEIPASKSGTALFMTCIVLSGMALITGFSLLVAAVYVH
jgi:hypothetical protein